jgi:hypothetical protein
MGISSLAARQTRSHSPGKTAPQQKDPADTNGSISEDHRIFQFEGRMTENHRPLSSEETISSENHQLNQLIHDLFDRVIHL